jgi:hypothetical protein
VRRFLCLSLDPAFRVSSDLNLNFENYRVPGAAKTHALFLTRPAPLNRLRKKASSGQTPEKHSSVAKARIHFVVPACGTTEVVP